MSGKKGKRPLKKTQHRLLEDKLERIRELHKPKTVNHKFDYFLDCDGIHEVKIDQDNRTEFLVGYKNPHIPPEWMYFDNVPNGNLFFFLVDLEQLFENEMYVEQ